MSPSEYSFGALAVPADHTAAYESLCNHTRETAKLASIMGLLEWDERTKMPPAAGDYRAEQISYLAGEIHKRQTNPAVGEWLAALVDSPLAADSHSAGGTVIRQEDEAATGACRRVVANRRARPADVGRSP